jgi:hypothetical protein
MKLLLHKDEKEKGSSAHIQVNLAAPTHWRTLRSKKNLHFANTPLKYSDL